MGKMGKFSATDMKKLQKQLNKIKEADADAFVEECARELAARLLAKVIKRTPVGDYSKEIEVTAEKDSKNHKKGDTYKKRVNPDGKVGGTLRRGWTAQRSGSGAEGLHTSGARQYVDTLRIHHYGGFLIIEIENPVEYASYVEYGHRTASHKGWVPGRFMLKMSEQEIQEIAPKVLENKIKKYLTECMK
ncbi:MAG: HK97 gp10 family phage protein [Lachnospiraceae bacterium]|nr:HK97 gp10 family phage protein [Lachnospiraceae bacterium]